MAFVCSLSSWARFVCLHLNLFILSISGVAVICTRSGRPFYILVSAAPKSHLVPLCHFSACAGSLCTSLTAFPFAILWAARGTKVPFSVPAFTCLLGFKVKHISTAAAQHKGGREAEILTAVKCL